MFRPTSYVRCRTITVDLSINVGSRPLKSTRARGAATTGRGNTESSRERQERRGRRASPLHQRHEEFSLNFEGLPLSPPSLASNDDENAASADATSAADASGDNYHVPTDWRYATGDDRHSCIAGNHRQHRRGGHVQHPPVLIGPKLLLWKVLAMVGTPLELIAVIRQFRDGMRGQVRVDDGESSDWFVVTLELCRGNCSTGYRERYGRCSAPMSLASYRGQPTDWRNLLPLSSWRC